MAQINRTYSAAVVLAALILAGCASGGRPTAVPAVPDAEASLAAYAVAAQRALENLPDAASARWTDPTDGTVRRLTILETETDASGQSCRRVRITRVDAAAGAVQTFCRDAASSEWHFTGADGAA